jgi:hypothetical protein
MAAAQVTNDIVSTDNLTFDDEWPLERRVNEEGRTVEGLQTDGVGKHDQQLVQKGGREKRPAAGIRVQTRQQNRENATDNVSIYQVETRSRVWASEGCPPGHGRARTMPRLYTPRHSTTRSHRGHSCAPTLSHLVPEQQRHSIIGGREVDRQTRQRSGQARSRPTLASEAYKRRKAQDGAGCSHSKVTRRARYRRGTAAARPRYSTRIVSYEGQVSCQLKKTSPARTRPAALVCRLGGGMRIVHRKTPPEEAMCILPSGL